MELGDEDLATMVSLLSGERLRTFLILTGSLRSAVSLHQQTLKVACSLMGVISVIEISLRNAICDRLSLHFKTDDWLRNPPSPFKWREQERGKVCEAVSSAQRAAYAKLGSVQKRFIDECVFRNGPPDRIGHEQHVKIRQRFIDVPNGQVIAQLTMFFWKRLFSVDYEQSLWRPSLKRVFPNKSLTRSDVALRLEQIYQTRNRIAHHELVYGNRLRQAIDAIDFVICHLGSDGTNPASGSPMMRFLREERRILDDQANALNARIKMLSKTAHGVGGISDTQQSRLMPEAQS
jgi:hypothetical protein